MLTGKSAFKRASAAESMTAFLREEPVELNGFGLARPSRPATRPGTPLVRH
ncbi:MAG TPA: hypothetical protein VIM00_11570 [Candidatus Acidoferrum sp.]